MSVTKAPTPAVIPAGSSLGRPSQFRQDFRDFLGIGWHFRKGLQVDGAGGIATQKHNQKVKESISIILGTFKGERWMRPEFGVGVDGITFEPMTPEFFERLKFEVAESLELFEPRVQVRAVLISQIEDNRVDVSIDYRIIDVNVDDNLVFPFLLGER